MIWVYCFIFCLYIILIGAFVIGFNRSNTKHKNHDDKHNFSIIIPFRNEEKNLTKLLESIKNLNYNLDKFEIIFIDDNSNDTSINIINDVLKKSNVTYSIIKNNRMSNSPKKDAITTAISLAKFNWIITTDADCILPKSWLQSFNSTIETTNVKMICAPVDYIAKDNFIEQFQLLDFLSMQGSTFGGYGINFPFMCNGANLVYLKSTFLELKGFNGNNHIASGDDVFLLEKFLEDDKKSVYFLKSEEAIVKTFPVNSWSKLINQRVRWAAKTNNFKSTKVKVMGLLILLTNFLFSLSIVLCFTNTNYKNILLILIISKIIIDAVLINSTHRFYKKKNINIFFYIISCMMYPLFNFVIIFKSLLFKYTWKDRIFKK